MPMKVYIYGAIFLALVGMAVYAKLAHDRIEHWKTRSEQTEATLKAERKARDHERSIAKAATDDHQSRLKSLEDARSSIPTRSVRLCRSPTGWVPAPAESPLGADAGSVPGHPPETRPDPEVSRDIGPELYQLADEKDKELARCAALQGWVRSR